jgi:hypothetical protein
MALLDWEGKLAYQISDKALRNIPHPISEAILGVLTKRGSFTIRLRRRCNHVERNGVAFLVFIYFKLENRLVGTAQNVS